MHIYKKPLFKMNMSNNLFTFLALSTALFIGILILIIIEDIAKTFIPKIIEIKSERETFEKQLEIIKSYNEELQINNEELQKNLTIVKNNNKNLQEKIENLMSVNELLNIQLDSIYADADVDLIKRNKTLSVKCDILREELDKTRQQIYSYNFM